MQAGCHPFDTRRDVRHRTKCASWPLSVRSRSRGTAEAAQVGEFAEQGWVLRSRPRVLVAAVGLAFVLAIGLGTTGVFTPKSQRIALGASTTLAIISGEVQIRHGATGDFVTATDGAILGPGDTIRTGTDARAVLTYFEGSTVEVEPDSELAIQTAHGNPDGSTVIEMQQNLGSTWHVVTHLSQGGSKYEVHTTSSTASVRGTAFTVGVTPEQTTTVTTTEGNVGTSDPAGTTAVAVTAGLTTTTKRGEAPAPPQQAPEPERKVTVTVGDQATLVVDTLGRANGITKDGKRVLQTPGARLEVVDGKLVVTLPNVPDGQITTHFQNTSKSDDVTVTTKVEDKGKKTVEVSDTVKPSNTPITGVEVKKGSGSAGSGNDDPKIDPKKPSDAKPPKVGETLPTPTTEDQEKAAELEKNKDTKPATEPDKKTNDEDKKTTDDPKKQTPTPGVNLPGRGVGPGIPSPKPTENAGNGSTTTPVKLPGLDLKLPQPPKDPPPKDGSVSDPSGKDTKDAKDTKDKK